jgi:adenylate cyclase
VRVQLLLTAFLLSTNLLGAIVVFVVSTWVVPAPAPNRATLVALAIAVPTYVALAVVVGVIWGTTQTLRALRWARDPELPAPTDDERVRALRVPLQLTLMQASLWSAATVLFTVLAVVLQPERAVSTGLTIWLSGVMVCGISFLLTEFTMRPIAARALAGAPVTARIHGVGVAGRMVIFWCLGTAAPLVGLLVTGIRALAGDGTSMTQLAIMAIVIGGVVLLIGLFVTVLNARAVVAPIESVRDGMVAVESGHLDSDVVVYDGTELGRLQSGFNHMVHGLREREQIRDLFGRHVGREVASAAAHLGSVELGGESRTVSVLFVDLVGSTTYATEHSPAEVVSVLNRFFAVVVDEVDQRRGLVNKFIGDAVLAIFGAPVELPDHAGAALGAARAMAHRLTVEVPEIGAGVGVTTGSVVAGNVGAEERFEYTVIGDAVNSAARLTDLAKDVPGRVLAGWDTIAAANVEEASHWERHGETTLRGRPDPTPLAVPAPSSRGISGVESRVSGVE